MQIAVSIRRTVVVDDDIDTFNVDTTAKYVRRNQYTLLEGLKRRIPVYPAALRCKPIYKNKDIRLNWTNRSS